MNILLYLSYFPTVSSMAAMAQATAVTFEDWGNYQKQSFRNRCFILGANGVIPLTVPVHFTHKKRQLFRDIKIADDGKWQVNHWKSLNAAYRTSPYFEYYEHDLKPLFYRPRNFLIDHLVSCLNKVSELIQLDLNHTFSETFETSTQLIDLRGLIEARSRRIPVDLQAYTQVFSDRFEFQNDLSILDLLFNEGPNTLNYLLSQDLNSLFRESNP